MPIPRLIQKVCLCFVVVFLAACSKSPSNPTGSSSEASPISGHEIRLAALSPAIAVMLRDLGYEDRIVAKHDYDLILSDQIPAAGSELGFDLETLIETKPTHVFFQRTSAERSSRFSQIADEQGWVVFERPLNTLDDIATTMDDLYYLFNGFPQREPGQHDMSEALDHALPSAALATTWSDLGPVADHAGRVLVLGSVDPIGAMGPGSYHYQIIERLGATPAITEGSMWIELDYEDLIELNPDAIIIIAPRVGTDESAESERFAEPAQPTVEDALALLGPIADLPISAIERNQIGIIDHPLGLLPSGALGEVAQDIARMLREWDQ